jgi:hypothetical protein
VLDKGGAKCNLSASVLKITSFMFIFRFVAFSVVLTQMSSHIFAQTLPANLTSVASSQGNLWLKMRQNLNGLYSIHADIDTVSVGEKPILQINPAFTVGTPIETGFHIWETPTSFKYEEDDINQGASKILELHTHTPTSDQVFRNLSGGYLVISSNPSDPDWNYSFWMDIDNAVFMPYSFFIQDADDGFPGYFRQMPHLNEITDLKFWNQTVFRAAASMLSNRDASIATIDVSVKGIPNRAYYSPSYTYEIYCSKKDDYYPIGFRKRNKAGVIVQEVTCNQMNLVKSTHDNFSFLFPGKITNKSYNDEGQLLWTRVSTISNVTVNEKFDSDDQFYTIDPSIGRRIWDKDKNVWIQVPK